ncbi:MAG TPA: 23S rRNA (adenine(2030)-N(6))-methyltransferase RlmJ, partial [Rhodanobacteraceae bacterium]
MKPLVRPMNYRHAFHAGNFADVFKHAVLIELLCALRAKSTPFCYFDTHAGRGCYDLAGEAARKTDEAADGVLRLLDLASPPPALAAYVEQVRAFANDSAAPDGRPYPGSPLLARQLLRDNDSAVLCELQEAEAQALHRLVHADKRFHVHRRDGYEALPALLPPREKRGLVLIDPPFEAQADEFRLIESALEQAMARWPTGRYAVWYPIKRGADVQPFRRWLGNHAAGNSLVGEFFIHPDNSALRLNGCGMALINPPWHMEDKLAGILTAMRQCLRPEAF